MSVTVPKEILPYFEVVQISYRLAGFAGIPSAVTALFASGNASASIMPGFELCDEERRLRVLFGVGVKIAEEFPQEELARVFFRCEVWTVARPKGEPCLIPPHLDPDRADGLLLFSQIAHDPISLKKAGWRPPDIKGVMAHFVRDGDKVIDLQPKASEDTGGNAFPPHYLSTLMAGYHAARKRRD